MDPGSSPIVLPSEHTVGCDKKGKDARYLIDNSEYNLYVVFVRFSEILSLPEGPPRTAAIAAWVQGLFLEEGQIPVLVGGAAVEILTGGAYTTGDFDFVGFVPTSVGRELAASGFKKTGRHWIHEQAEIFLEFPGEALGTEEKAVRRRAFGYDVVVVSVEDLVVDRLGAWAYWKSGVDGANAFLLFRTCRDEIDHDRLALRVHQAGFEGALNALRAFDIEWSDSEPDSGAFETWANNGPPEETS